MADVENPTRALLELYKLAVEMADRASARRAGANSFFVTLNTALAAVVGMASAARKPTPAGQMPSFDAFGVCVTAVAGIVLATVWWAILRYYRRLSKAKWDVINRLECRLPAQPFTDEWHSLHPADPSSGPSTESRKRWFRLWRRVKHREATAVEQVVPFVFVLLYVILAARAAV